MKLKRLLFDLFCKLSRRRAADWLNGKLDIAAEKDKLETEENK